MNVPTKQCIVNNALNKVKVTEMYSIFPKTKWKSDNITATSWHVNFSRFSYDSGLFCRVIVVLLKGGWRHAITLFMSKKKVFSIVIYLKMVLLSLCRVWTQYKTCLQIALYTKLKLNEKIWLTFLLCSIEIRKNPDRLPLGIW